MSTNRVFQDDSDGLASYIKITGQNLPAGGEINVWCVFTVIDNNTYTGTYEL
jgi:hypothetical protein